MKKLLPVFLLIAFIISGCSARKDMGCEDIMIRMLCYTNESSRENGKIFLLSAQEWENEYFSDENKAILYGDKAFEHSFEKIEDCAIFVCSRYPEEIAIFKCYSRSDTKEITQMCMLRADSIKVALRGTEWSEKAEMIKISVHKRFVIMSFTDDPAKIEEKLRALA